MQLSPADELVTVPFSPGLHGPAELYTDLMRAVQAFPVQGPFARMRVARPLGSRGSETDEDRAALIAALGWCSGWRGLTSFA